MCKKRDKLFSCKACVHTRFLVLSAHLHYWGSHGGVAWTYRTCGWADGIGLTPADELWAAILLGPRSLLAHAHAGAGKSCTRATLHEWCQIRACSPLSLPGHRISPRQVVR